MMLAEMFEPSLPTTLGGVAVFALVMIVTNFFADKKKNERDVQKTRNLDEQTNLLTQQTTLMRELVEQGKKDQKGAKKTRKLLKRVNSTVAVIREDQIASKKL